MEPTSRSIPTSPEKDIFDTLVADISYEDAICELIDNSIDSAHRLEDTDSVRIDVRYSSSPGEEHDTMLRVKDNGGGIERDNLPILTKLSSSRSVDLDTSIGTYGVGLKRACAKLGGDSQILSRYKDSDAAYGFKIPVEWYQQDDWRDFTEFRDDSLSAGFTEITIYDISYSFDSESLKNHISRTYAKYLRGEAADIDVDIYVNGDEIKPSSEVNWSYTPFDFHPRRYPDIPIMPEEMDMDEPVYLTITVGILRGSDDDNEPGTDIYCQGRKVVHADQGRKGGHVRQYLRDWSNDKGRFKIVLEFETEGNNKHLPWTSTKADIDVSSLVYIEGMDWARKVANAHRKIGYNIPDPFIKPYTSDHEDATGIEIFDSYREYSPERERIRRGDKIDYEAAKGLVINIKNRADRHATFQIVCPSSTDNEHFHGYRGRVIKSFTSKYEGVVEDDLVKVESTPQQLNQQNYEALANDLQQKAETDAEDGIRDDLTVKSWQEPLYTYHLQQEVGSLEQLDDLSALEEPDNTEEETEQKETQEETEEETEQVTKLSSSRSVDLDTPIGTYGVGLKRVCAKLGGDSQKETQEETEEETQEETEEETEQKETQEETEEETEQKETQEETEEETEQKETEQEETEQEKTQEETEQEKTEQEETQEETEDIEVDVIETEGTNTVVIGDAEATTIPVEIPANLWTDLCKALGLPDSTDPPKVGDEVSELLESLIRMRTVDEARSDVEEATID